MGIFLNAARSRRRATWAFAALCSAVTVALTGCGGGSSGSGESAGAPAKIVALWEVKGESANAIDDYENGAQIALDQINKKGGVLGQPLQYERIASNVLDPQASRTSFLKAVDAKPAGIIGLPSGTVVEAYTRDIESNKIPVVQVSTDIKLAFGGPNGSQWLYAVNANDRHRATNTVKLAQKLGAKKIGLFATDETFGREAVNDQTKAIKDLGLELGATRLVSTKATDLTEAVLALKDVDVVLVSAFPNIAALYRNQMIQNNITTPIIGSNAVPIAVNSGLIKDKALEKVFAVTACAPAFSDRAQSKEFADAYKAKFGRPPSASATNAHDSLLVMAAAINKTGTTDREKVREALDTLNYTDGACVDTLKSDGAHFLAHNQVAVEYKADGSGSVTDTYTIPETEKGKA